MSETGLQNYLRENPLDIPQQASDRFAVLLSDSQGIKLENVNTGRTLPLKFLCHKGWQSETAVDNAIRELDALIEAEKKPVVLYIWLGTCDITKRISYSKGFIDKRYEGIGEATEKILVQYTRIKEFIFQKQGTIKFICVPPYSVSAYNKDRRHKHPEKFFDSDNFVKQEVQLLNRKIEELNTSLGRNTLKFQTDIIKTRSGNRQSINYHLLRDGLHPKRILAKKWLRRLQLDVCKECWLDKETFSVHVDPQELQALS